MQSDQTMQAEQEYFTLTDSSGGKHRISARACELSEYLTSAIGDDDDDSIYEEDIPVPNVDGDTLKKVISYCEHYVQHPMDKIDKPLRSPDLVELVGEWYATFVTDGVGRDATGKTEITKLTTLLTAADFMGVHGLVSLSAAAIASHIRGRSPEQIKKTFGIDKDFTEEEKKRVLENHPWFTEKYGKFMKS